jgi:hypothetical protein
MTDGLCVGHEPWSGRRRLPCRAEEVRAVEPSGDVQANTETADTPAPTQVHTLAVQDIRQAQTAEKVSIAIRTHLWIAWARIALKHEATARAARQEMLRPGADQYRLLLQEADAGLGGICAAAFALEALSPGTQGAGCHPTGDLGQVQAEEKGGQGASSQEGSP